MNKVVNVRGDFGRGHGYGQITNTVADGFERHGIQVRRVPNTDGGRTKADSDAADLIIFSPIFNELYGYPPVKVRFHFTMWETSKLMPDWVNALNLCARVIVPNWWNKANFMNDGVTTPISVVPLCVDSKVFNCADPVERSGNFTFGCGGDMQNGDERKQVSNVVRLFVRTFAAHENVRLLVKVSGPFPRFTDPRVFVIRSFLSSEELADCYRSLDVFVSLATEGWGLMQHQAMACGKPVIGPVYAGLAEFLNERTGYPVQFTEELATQYFAESAGYWAKCDEEDVIKQMRFCFNHREAVAEKGKLAAVKAISFSEANMMEKLMAAVLGEIS